MLKRNLNLIVISMFLFCALFLYYTASPYNGIYYYRALYTLADAYIYFLDPRVYGMLILPFVIILFTNLIKYDDEVNCLIRLGSVKRLVSRRMKKGIIFSAICTVFVMIVVTFISSLQTETLINWGSESSIYLLKTEHSSNIGFIIVFIIAAVTLLIRNFFVCLWIIFLDLMLHNSIITFIILLSVVAFEMFQRIIPLFCNFLTIDYRMWDSMGFKMGYLLYIILTCIIYYVLMKQCIKKKEWI